MYIDIEIIKLIIVVLLFLGMLRIKKGNTTYFMSFFCNPIAMFLFIYYFIMR